MNPFDVFDQRLESIEKFLADLNAKFNTQSPEKEDYVEADEAAKIVYLSIDRFYAIHNKYFSHIKMGRKILFSRKELQDYMESKKVQPVGKASKEAEEFRIKRLHKA